MKDFALKCFVSLITCVVVTYVLDMWIFNQPGLFWKTLGLAMVLAILLNGLKILITRKVK